MSTLLVNIIAGNTIIEGTKISNKAQVGAIAKQVADATGNALLDTNNNPIVYSFKHNEALLDPKLKFDECGIRNGDRLVLTKDSAVVNNGHVPQPPTQEGVVSLLIVPLNSAKYEKTLSINTSIPDLIRMIITENNLPTNNNEEYILTSRHTARQLQSGTLASNNIPHKDTLTLTKDATAGSRKHASAGPPRRVEQSIYN